MKITIIVSVSLLVGVIIGATTEAYQLDPWINLLMGSVSMIILLIGGYFIDTYLDKK